MIKEGCSVAKLLDDNAIIDRERVKEATKNLRVYNGVQFETVEEKDEWIDNEKKYSQPLSDFWSMNEWYVPDMFKEKYNELCSLGVPQVEKWKNDYDMAIKVGKPIVEEINNPFINYVANAILELEKAPSTVEKYSLLDYKQQSIDDFEKYNGLKQMYSENELTVIKIDFAPTILFVSTRAFYLINKASQSVETRFELDDISCLVVKDKSIFDSRFAKVWLVSGESYKLWGERFPDDDFPYITRFLKFLILYIRKNDKIKKPLLERICYNSCREYLTQKTLEQLQERVGIIEYLLSDMSSHDEEISVRKYTYQIMQQDDLQLYYMIKENSIGLEYVLAYSGRYLVTDQAIYYPKSYGWLEF